MKMEARYLEQEGSVREALALYQDILVQLEPKPLSEQMLPFYLKVGDLARRTGDAGLARTTLIKGADRFAKAGDAASVGELCLNILRADPGHKDVYAQYARRMLDYGHVEPARQLLLDYAKRARSDNLGKVLSQMERWPKKDLQRLLSDFLDRIVPEERRRRRSSDHRRRPSAAIHEADSEMELDLSDAVPAETDGDSEPPIASDAPEPDAMPEEREQARGVDAAEEHPEEPPITTAPAVEPLAMPEEREALSGDVETTEERPAPTSDAQVQSAELGGAAPDVPDGEVPDDALVTETDVVVRESAPRREAVEHDQADGEPGAVESAPPLEAVEPDGADGEPGAVEPEPPHAAVERDEPEPELGPIEAKDEAEIEEAVPAPAPDETEDTSVSATVGIPPVTVSPVVDAPTIAADEQPAELPSPVASPVIDEEDGAEPQAPAEPAEDRTAASALFTTSALRYLVPVGLAAAAGIVFLTTDPFGGTSERATDGVTSPAVTVAQEPRTEPASEQETIAAVSRSELASPDPLPPPTAEQALEQEVPADPSPPEPESIPAQPATAPPPADVPAAEREDESPPAIAAVAPAAADDSQPAPAAPEDAVASPAASEGPTPERLPEGTVLEAATVVVEDAPIVEIAPFDAPAGRGYRILQLVGDADTLALTVVPLDAGTASQVGAGRVRVREADGSSIGTTRFGRYLVTGKAELPAPDVEALLQRLIEITPE
jgi:hypothetical protein